MKRVIIVHGIEGSPEDAWFPWMKEELEKRKYEVHVLKMPESDTPQIAVWVPFLAKAVGTLDANTILVGHSIGCQTIMRYLEKQDVGAAAGCVFVGGWFTLNDSELEEDEIAVLKPWIDTPFNLPRAKKNAGNVTAIFSDDDQFVPVENAERFLINLGARIVLEHGLGHFDDDSGITELPSALDAVLSIKTRSEHQ